MLVAFGTQLTRLENRYLLSGITFKEAYIRKWDQFNTLISMAHDMKQFGLSEQFKHYIFQLSSEIVHPSFNLTTVDESKSITVMRNECKDDGNNDNSNNDNDDHNENVLDSAFTFDGSSISYNVTNEFGNSIGIRTPIWDNYKNKRQYFGQHTGRETIFDKYGKNIKPKFCSNGSCWEYNFGHANCPHANSCSIKTEAHLKTHFCAVCDGPHPLIECPFVRCFLFISILRLTNWFNYQYDLLPKYPAKPYKKNGGGNSSGNKRKGYSSGGGSHRGFDSRSSTRGGHSNYDSYNQNDESFRGPPPPHHFDQRDNSGRSGGNNNRRNGGSRNDHNKQSNHNGNDGYRR